MPKLLVGLTDISTLHKSSNRCEHVSTSCCGVEKHQPSAVDYAHRSHQPNTSSPAGRETGRICVDHFTVCHLVVWSNLHRGHSFKQPAFFCSLCLIFARMKRFLLGSFVRRDIFKFLPCRLGSLCWRMLPESWADAKKRWGWNTADY